jgi:hypothetical protein
VGFTANGRFVVVVCFFGKKRMVQRRTNKRNEWSSLFLDDNDGRTNESELHNSIFFYSCILERKGESSAHYARYRPEKENMIVFPSFSSFAGHASGKEGNGRQGGRHLFLCFFLCFVHANASNPFRKKNDIRLQIYIMLSQVPVFDAL